MTATTNPCDDLAARFERMASEGLVDVKFFLDTSDKASKTILCSEVTSMLVAFESGKKEVLDFKDSTVQ